MTTCYYWHLPKCEHCGHVPEPELIGLSACGWEFMLYGEVHKTVADWENHLGTHGQIKDTNGNVLSEQEFWHIVESQIGGKYQALGGKYQARKRRPIDERAWRNDGVYFSTWKFG